MDWEHVWHVYSWPSISLGSTITDSINHESKTFGKYILSVLNMHRLSHTLSLFSIQCSLILFTYLLHSIKCYKQVKDNLGYMRSKLVLTVKILLKVPASQWECLDSSHTLVSDSSFLQKQILRVNGASSSDWV